MRKFSDQERADREAAAIQKQQALLAASADPNRLTCLECGWHAMNSLQKHLERAHSITPTQYYVKHAVGKEAIYAPKLRACLSEKVAGEKNPAYQHGGRLSPFSTKFHKYATADEAKAGIAIVGQKVRVAQLDHGNTKLKHYLDKGFTEAEAEQALRDRQQTFTLEKCIQRHGSDEGLRVWQERQDAWQATLNSKPLEEIELINNSKIWKSGGVSKQSIQLFEALDYKEGRYSKQGGEVCVKLELFGKIRHKLVDFVLGNKAIEYFGTYWHADPRRYKDDDIIQFRSGNRTTKSVRDADAEYLSKLKLAGYDVLVIWEADYMADPLKTVQRCKDFLAS